MQLRRLVSRVLGTLPKPHADESVVRVKGEYRDRIFDAQGNLLEDRGWKGNQVQNTNATVLAALVKKQASWQGFQYLALGEGQSSWDTSAPAQAETDTTLNNEGFRKAVSAGNVTWRDPSSFADVDPTPTNVIQVDITIATTEANGLSLREFGLFGGTATVTPDSGYMMNWVVHSRIDKDPSISIQRSIRWTFTVV